MDLDAIRDVDYMHKKRVCKDFETKKIGECHDLYLKSNTLLLADLYENFMKNCLGLYQKDRAQFISAARLAWQAALKKLN